VPADERNRLYSLQTGEDVARTMGEMKGATMKLGQVLSLMTGVIPEEMSDRLSSLHSQAPPMAFALVEQVFREEFGRPPKDVFASFERTPFAAASIGQVHRAMTHEGREVAVKVQYPGVAKAIDADLANVGMLIGLGNLVARGLDGPAIANEIRAGISAELDYRQEAANQQRFRSLLQGHPFIVIPEVLPQLSTARVLTQEYIEGQPLRAARDWSAADRDRVGEIIFRFAFGSIYRHGLFNGDPHPGNYILMPDGRIAFVDFGCVAEFDEGTVEGFARIIRALLEGRREDWRAACEDVGILHRGAPFSTAELYEHLHWFWKPILEPEMRFTRELAAEMVRRNSQTSGRGGEINRYCNIPAGMVFLTRINFGLAGLLAGLDTTGPWQGIIREYVYGDAPATAVGRAAAEAIPGRYV
jgi:predicted unusual protein kinase regulating ubiquinone biosynthesis (AarF/ABC1/UbiB family)